MDALIFNTSARLTKGIKLLPDGSKRDFVYLRFYVILIATRLWPIVFGSKIRIGGYRFEDT